MTNLVQVEATSMLNASFGRITFPAPTTPMKLRLMLSNGSSTASGTEITNSGGSTYAAQSMASALADAAAGVLTTSGGAITFTNMPALTTAGIEVWDSTGTPVRKWFGALTAAKTTGLGDTLSFASSSITATLG